MNSSNRNIRILVFIVAVMLAIVGIVLFKKYRRPEASPPLAGSSMQTNLVASEKTEDSAPAGTSPGPRGTTRAEQLRMATEANNVPIQFWGKVVDQDDSPLAGVTIRTTTRLWGLGNLAQPDATFPETKVVSASDGKFHINGGKGDVLTIKSLEKQGYEADQGALRSFGYNTSENIRPDPERPVTLRMWKTGTKQPLIVGDKAFPLTPDGRAYTVDLLNGTITEGSAAEGDLRMWVKRPDNVSLGQKYDWACQISAIDGGLVVEPDAYSSMTIAPESGYQTAYDYARAATDRPWSDGIGNRRYFLKSRGGKVYGRVTINLYAHYNNAVSGRVRLNYALNPTGSRFLN